MDQPTATAPLPSPPRPTLSPRMAAMERYLNIGSRCLLAYDALALAFDLGRYAEGALILGSLFSNLAQVLLLSSIVLTQIFPFNASSMKRNGIIYGSLLVGSLLCLGLQFHYERAETPTRASQSSAPSGFDGQYKLLRNGR